MQGNDIELTIGALLHDIGKVIYRDGSEKKTHSLLGYEFLRENGVEDESILNCVKYHHAAALKDSGISNDDPAYLVYMADNIASSIDRRKSRNSEPGFEIHTPMQPVFNILNGNHSDLCYSFDGINMESDINYPSAEKRPFGNEDYKNIIDNVRNNLKGIEFNEKYINSLLEVLEANLSYVPSSTSNEEVPDISLYDHLKLTAAFSVCMEHYLAGQEIRDLKECLFDKGDEFYSRKAFMLASLDISGIQKFIYTIHTRNALRTLRARSFYLEIMMEHIIDELLEKEGLNRSCLLYSGGGHCYIILPATKECRDIFDDYLHDLNRWFLNTFETDLYVAGAYTECSSDDLKNVPVGSYEEIFRTLSIQLSEMKGNRYSAQDLIRLNTTGQEDYGRECSVCKRVSRINEDGRCPVCAAFEKLSAVVLYSDFFTVIKGESKDALPLPGGFSLVHDSGDSLRDRIKDDPCFVRAYSKNKAYTGKNLATKLWVGDYSSKATFEEFADSSRGIKRVGILRADVDNLGHAFVAGFRDSSNDDRYVTISRTATLSRQLSLFFKLHINKLMENPEFTLDGRKPEKRNLTIVYSGGDDIFVVGSWNEVIEFAVDLKNAFEKYSEGTLTLSAGIGLYDDGYPVSSSAYEVEAMVDRSKELPGKDSITLLEDGEEHSLSHGDKTLSISDGTYRWSEFEENVIGEKYAAISDYFSAMRNEHGNALLYKMLELIRNRGDRLNFARFVYLLSRLEPEDDDKEKKEAFEIFSGKMYGWIRNEKDSRELKTAIAIYVLLNRKEESV